MTWHEIQLLVPRVKPRTNTMASHRGTSNDVVTDLVAVPELDGARPAADADYTPHVMRDGYTASIGYATDAWLLIYGDLFNARGARQVAC